MKFLESYITLKLSYRSMVWGRGNIYNLDVTFVEEHKVENVEYCIVG